MKAYRPQSFDHLTGLDGISDAQVKEHLELYQGYVKQVNTLSEKLQEMLGGGKVSGTDPYFADSLQGWEQGRFIRFHGVARWIGWLWPYAAMAWLLARPRPAE